MADILWEEYDALPAKAKWAYEIVMVFTLFGIHVPTDMMHPMLAELTGDAGYFASDEFRKDTNDIISQAARNGAFSLRHRVIAEVMLERFSKEPGTEAAKARIVDVFLETLRPGDIGHDAVLEIALERKLWQVLDQPTVLEAKLVGKRFPRLPDKTVAQILNSIARIFQGEGQYKDGMRCCEESLARWDHIGNQASYLKGFCAAYAGDRPAALLIAEKLVRHHEQYWYHMMHGISLLRMLHEWDKVDEALQRFKQALGEEAESYEDYNELRREADLFRHVSLPGTSFAGLPPTRVLERLEWMQANDSATEAEMSEHFRRLIEKHHNLDQAYLGFFSFLSQLAAASEANGVRQYREIIKESEKHLEAHKQFQRKYPQTVLSILHASLARALFKIDYTTKDGYTSKALCEQHFATALKLNANNLWAHSWYGTFLKDAAQDFDGALREYRRAVNGDKKNPIFLHNLALLLYQWPVFERRRLDEAAALIEKAAALCPVEHVGQLSEYIKELQDSIKLLKERSDLQDGQSLDSASLAGIDA